MNKYLRCAWLMWLLTVIWVACSDDEGKDEIRYVVPEVSVQNLTLKNVVLPERPVRLRAHIVNSTEADIYWSVDGEVRATGTEYEFSSAAEGTFSIKATASNLEGETADSLVIRVADGFKISDIAYWAGEGENQSVLAIQWVANEVADLLHPADDQVFFRAWGYRWKPADECTGYEMLEAIARKDARLFVLVLRDEFQGMVVKGFGYDGDGDGKIEIRSKTSGTLRSLHLTEADFANGICLLQDNGANIDGFEVLSAGDYWIGGWHEAYTSYWLASGEAVLEPAEYEYSNFYASHRLLEDKSWDVWTFSPVNSSESNMLPIPELLRAAPVN